MVVAGVEEVEEEEVEVVGEGGELNKEVVEKDTVEE